MVLFLHFYLHWQCKLKNEKKQIWIQRQQNRKKLQIWLGWRTFKNLNFVCAVFGKSFSLQKAGASANEREPVMKPRAQNSNFWTSVSPVKFAVFSVLRPLYSNLLFVVFLIYIASASKSAKTANLNTGGNNWKKTANLTGTADVQKIIWHASPRA